MKINKDCLIGYLVIAIVSFLLGLALHGAVNVVADKPNWTCSAEDEVLIIDNTCVHIDEIENEFTGYRKGCDEIVHYPDAVENGVFRQGGDVCEVFIHDKENFEVYHRGAI